MAVVQQRRIVTASNVPTNLMSCRFEACKTAFLEQEFDLLKVFFWQRLALKA
jgi:hypothetical protein